MILSASKVWLWVQRDGGFRSILTWTKNYSSLHRHPEMSLEVVEETLMILQENLRVFLLELGDPVSRLVFSGPDLLREVWFVHLRLEIWICHLLWEISPPLHWVFKSRFPMRPSFPTPQGLRSVRHPSKFSRRRERIRGTIQVKLSFQIDGFGTDPSQLQGNTQPMNQTEWSVLQKVSQNVFRMVFSHQTRDLVC